MDQRPLFDTTAPDPDAGFEFDQRISWQSTAQRAPMRRAAAGALPAVTGAVLHALEEFQVRHIDMPLTPEKVWHAIRSAR